MAHRGEAADYYTGGPPQNATWNPGYGQPAPPPPPPPPQYGPSYAAPPTGPPMNGNQHYAPPPPHTGPAMNGVQQPYDEKASFDQTFAIPKPKYHDWWAGLLFIATFLGFVAVSGIAIHGYCKCAAGGEWNGMGWSLTRSSS